MLGFFPDPYPDELLYSACARYSDRISYPNRSTAAQELFGAKDAAAIIDLPCRIDNLIRRLPPNHRYTADRIINDHTVFPFYEPFLSPPRRQIVRDEMRGEGGSRIRARLGIAADRLTLPTHLRFCPSCVDDDRQKFGEAYWHRIHQIAGVEVCPHHMLFLELSSAPWRGRKSTREFFSAERVVHNTSPRRLNLSDSAHSAHLKLAHNAAWLLNWHGPFPSPEVLRDRYYNALITRGYAYHYGRVKRQQLLDGFVEFYSSELLEELQCSVSGLIECWLIRLMLKNRLAVANPPLRHLLLIIFLGYTAEHIFTSFEEYKPFGDGPWPCLNPAASHYGEPVVIDCHVGDRTRLRGRDIRPEGTFTCDCGFIYVRIGPDSENESRSRTDRILSYGETWEKRLTELWVDDSVTIERMSIALNVGQNTVKRHAIRLGLQYPRESFGSNRASANVHERYKIIRPTLQEALVSRREEWLKVLKENPDANRMQLEEKATYLYFWLKRYDPVWFNAHLPAPRYAPSRDERVDWASEDIKLSASIEDATTRIKNRHGRPTRVSITAIIREVGQQSWIQKRLHKLPLTASALAANVESLEDYNLRQIHWAEECYRSEGGCPSRFQLERRAHTRNKAGGTPKVQMALDAAMARLHSASAHAALQVNSLYGDEILG